MHALSALVRVRFLRVVESGLEINTYAAAWGVAILDAVVLGYSDWHGHGCNSGFPTNTLNVDLLCILNLSVGGIAFGCIGICVKIRRILDVGMIMLIPSDRGLAGNALYCQDSCLVLSA